MMNFNERLMAYNAKRFFGHGRLNGKTPEEALLGKGASGYVYSIIRNDSDRHPLAVKVIPIPHDDYNYEGLSVEERRAKEEEHRRKIERQLANVREEIRIMKKLEGESHIAYFSDSHVETRSDAFGYDVLIFMDQLMGLKAFLKQFDIKDAREYCILVLNIWRDISAALRVCENNSILHLDVKPDNIFYATSSQYFKLSDFGVANNGSTVRKGVCCGTPDYMAPEMYYRKGCDCRADIYSLGVTIYQLLNGNKLPLQKESRQQAIDLRMEGRFSIPPIDGIPQDVNDLLLKCIAHDPKNRPSGNREVEELVTSLYIKYKNDRAAWSNGQRSGRNGLPIRWIILGSIAMGAVILAVLLITGSSGKKDKQKEQESLPAQDHVVETVVVEATDVPTQEPTAVPVVEPSDTPSPVPDPETEQPLALNLSDLILDTSYFLPIEYEGENALLISGRVKSNADSGERMRILLNQIEATDAEWTQDGEDWRFVVRMEMDMEGRDALNVSIALEDTDLKVESSIPVARAELVPDDTNPVPAGETVQFSGLIKTNTELTDGVELVIDGNTCEATIEREDDGYRYLASTTLPVDRIDPVRLWARVKIDGIAIDTDGVEIPVAAVPTELTISLDETCRYLDAATSGRLVLNGFMKVQGHIDMDALHMYFNSMEANVRWDAVDGGYLFEAVQDMDLEGRDALELQVRCEDGVESNALTVPILAISTRLNDCTLTEHVPAELTGTLTVNPEMPLEEIQFYIDQSPVEVELRRREEGSFDFSLNHTPSAPGYMRIEAKVRDSAISALSNEIEVLGTPAVLSVPTLNEAYALAGTGSVTVSGSIESTGEIQEPSVRFNGIEASIGMWQQTETGYDFNATAELTDLRADESIAVEVLDAEDGRVAPVQCALAVAQPSMSASVMPQTVQAVNGEREFEIVLDAECAEAIDLENMRVSIDGEAVETWPVEENPLHRTFVLSIDSAMKDTVLHVAVEASVSGREPVSADAEIAVTERILEAIRLNDAEWTQAWQNSGASIEISGVASPDAGLELYVNNNEQPAASFVAGSDGAFSETLRLGELQLEPGENRITVAYPALALTEDDYQPMEMRLMYDGDAPVIEAADEIDQYTESIMVSVADMDQSCTVELLVDGSIVDTKACEEGGCAFDGVSAYVLAPGSTLVLRAWDESGNASDKEIQYIYKYADLMVNMEGAGGLYNASTLPELTGTAEPNAEIALDLNGTAYRISAGEDGRFAWTIPEPQEGRNVLNLRYWDGIENVDLGANDAKEFLFEYDSIAPDFELAPVEIMQAEPILVTSAEEDVWYAQMYLNGEIVGEAQRGENNAAELTISKELLPEASCDLIVAVYDRAGNHSEKSVHYKYIHPIMPDPISEELARQGLDPNGECRYAVKAGDELILSGSAEPGAELKLVIVSELNAPDPVFDEISTTVGADGRFAMDATNLLRQGFNQLCFLYADSNGYPDDHWISPDLVFYSDIQPSATLEETLITRDTETISITNISEYVRIVTLNIDGAPVTSPEAAEGYILGMDISITDEIRNLMRTASQIEVIVEDIAGNRTAIPLRYENTSTRMDVCADIDLSGAENLGVGEKAAVSGVIFCSEYDMPDYVSLYLMNEDQKKYLCKFDYSQMEDAEYTAEAARYELSDYADHGYYISAITVPQNIEEGSYRLYADIEPDEGYIGLEEYLLADEVRISAPESDDISNYFNEAEQYAVGFDKPVQAAFRTNNVVLTGWVCHGSDKIAYFDQIEIENEYGQKKKIVLDEYILKSKRAGVGALAAQESQTATVFADASEEDAGFVLKLDLSEYDIALNGSKLIVRLYSWDEVMETDAVQATASIVINIDDAADEVTDAWIENKQKEWAPIEVPSDEVENIEP